MLRPCDQCGGRGTDAKYVTPMNPTGECPRCKDMPWLPARFRSFAEMGAFISAGGNDAPSYRPDPDTVMHWCVIHNAIAGNEDETRCDSRYASSALTGDCELVWIERPVPLEEADDA